MKFNVFKPVSELNHIVKQYVVIESLEDIERMLFLPDGGNFIVFNQGLIGCSNVYNGLTFDIPQKYSVSIKTNKVKKAIINANLNLKTVCFPLILVELRPVGFYKLFHKDASVLNHGYMELDDDIIDSYFSRLYKHKSIADEIAYLNTTLKSLDASHKNERLCVEDVIDAMIHEYRYDVTIQALVDQFSCSRSTMERKFKKYIGFTPKNFLLISKFTETLLSYIEDECTFHDIDYIYSDNSHMNRVFKKILGIVPSEIFNEVLNENIRIYQLSQTKALAENEFYDQVYFC